MFVWTAGLSKEESATVECPVSSLCLLSSLFALCLFSYCSMALLIRPIDAWDDNGTYRCLITLPVLDTFVGAESL
jgi:hypothetical protein